MEKKETKVEEKAEVARTPKTKKKVSVKENIKKSEENISKVCNDKNCHIHGTLKARGRIFEGRVIKKFNKRIAIEFERMIYVRKYERYARYKTKIHARLPICMEKDINIGDLVRVQECRPLSKIVHFIVIKKIKSKEEK